MAKPTILDVAKAAGVSLGTASRVINGHESVNPAMKAQVEKAIQQLGYRPDAVAQSMRRKSTRAIGILVRDFTVPGFNNFVKSAQTILYEAGYVLILAGSEDKPERELAILNALTERRADGLILTTAAEGDRDLVKAHQSLTVPVIMLDRDPLEGQDAMLIAHRDGMLEAMRYLFDLGHRRIALITGDAGLRPARERISGYGEAFHRRSLAIDPSLIRTRNFTSEYAFAETSALLSSPNPPTAVIAGGVNMLRGVLHAVKTCGLSIPHDLSVIGSINSDLSALTVPPVTVVQVDYHSIGVEAAQLLLDRLNNKVQGGPRIIKFGSSLIIRESCAPPRAGSG
jgi:LacI family transcriptional regulator